MSKKLALVLSTLFLVLTSFFGFTASASADATVKAGDLTAGGLKFNPSLVSISAGETVTWTMGDLAPHNVVFTQVPDGVDPGSISLDALSMTGVTHSVTFDVPGTYAYLCIPHAGAGMQGYIQVD